MFNQLVSFNKFNNNPHYTSFSKITAHADCWSLGGKLPLFMEKFIYFSQMGKYKFQANMKVTNS